MRKFIIAMLLMIGHLAAWLVIVRLTSIYLLRKERSGNE